MLRCHDRLFKNKIVRKKKKTYRNVSTAPDAAAATAPATPPSITPSIYTARRHPPSAPPHLKNLEREILRRRVVVAVGHDDRISRLAKAGALGQVHGVERLISRRARRVEHQGVKPAVQNELPPHLLGGTRRHHLRARMGEVGHKDTLKALYTLFKAIRWLKTFRGIRQQLNRLVTKKENGVSMGSFCSTVSTSPTII